MNVLGLVQLCDAAPAAGGYGHSFGIENLARSGQLVSPEQLASLVKTVLTDSIGPADGVASGIAFRAARHGDFEKLPQVCHVMSSDRVPASMRLASLQLGVRLWGISRAWEWTSGIHQQFDDLAEHTDLHHAVAFGALVSETTGSQIRAIATYLFNTARSLVMAAVHAIPLDEAVGLRILSSVQPTISELAAACADKDINAILPLRKAPPREDDPFRALFP